MKSKSCNFTKELKIGRKIELEHAHNFPKSKRLIMADKIARDHIREFKCYYSKGLVPMERRLKKK